MKNELYLMEYQLFNRLLDNRKELLEIAKSYSSPRELKADFDALMADTDIYLASEPSYQVIDGVAYIPIVGELTPKATKDACGAYTAEALTEYGFIANASMMADEDPEVEKLVYQVNSGGGYADGIMTAVSAMRAVNKPTEAIVEGTAASAAYWLASQADKITAANELVRVGSIGVVVEEYDNTKQLENMGIEKRVYTSTDAPDKRLDTRTEDGRGKLVDRLDDMHRVFVKYVAEGRGVTADEVNSNFGRGGVLLAEEALRRGMIDEIMDMPSRREDNISDVITETIPAAATAEEIKEEVKMQNLEELKREYPGLYAEAVKDGIMQERARISELNTYAEADPGNEKLAQVVNEAIASGQAVSEISARLQVAIRDGGKLAGENPESIETAETVDQLSADDIAAAKAAGMSIEDYRKYSTKKGVK